MESEIQEKIAIVSERIREKMQGFRQPESSRTAFESMREHLEQLSFQNVAAENLRVIAEMRERQWIDAVGVVPEWVGRRKIQEIGQINANDVATIASPPKETIRLIKPDDEAAIKSAWGKMMSDKAKEKHESKRLNLMNAFLESGLSKNEFATKYHSSYHISPSTLRKKLQNIENK